MFRVKLDNDHVVLGHVAGKMRRFRIRILPGRPRPRRAVAVRPRPRPDHLPPPVGRPLRELALIEAFERRSGAPGRASCAGWATTPPSCARGALAVTSVDAMVEGIHFRLGADSRRGRRPARAGRRAVGPGRDGRRAGRGLRRARAADGPQPRTTCSRCRRGAGARAASGRRRSPAATSSRGPALTVAVTVVGWADARGRARRPRRRAPGRPRRRHGRHSAAPAPGWPCSRAAATGAGRSSQRLPAAGAAARRGRGARRGRRARDDRPLRRPGLRRRGTSRGAAACASGIDSNALPLAPGVAEVARALGRDPAELAATGGEDFELCVCVRARPARGGRGARPR